jgi:hypothetical protein
MDPTILRELLTYDPFSGVFIRKKNQGVAKAGDRMGHIRRNGRRYIAWKRKNYPCSHLAYLWMRGEWPPHYVAHKNGNQDDDRWRNLKLIKPKRRYNGAHLQKWGREWQAKVTINGRGVHLGFFDTPEDAYAAWRVARKKKKNRSEAQRMIDRELRFLFTPRSDKEIAELEATQGIKLDKRRRSSSSAPYDVPEETNEGI